MIAVEDIPAELGLASVWEKRAENFWLTARDLDVEKMARLMNTWQARFVTITARPAPNGECRLDYHWDYNGQLLTLATSTHEGSVASIAQLCPAADWVEREVHDYFAVDFMGRQANEPLMLRPKDDPGVFLPKGDRP